MRQGLVTAANENWVTAFRLLADATPEGANRTFGDVPAVWTGIPVPLFNSIFLFEPPATGDLADAISWMAGRDAPFQIAVTDPGLDATEPVAADHGLERAEDPLPGMALASLGTIPEPTAPVQIDPVTDAAGVEEFAEVTAAAFEMPMEIARRLAPEAIVRTEGMTALLGRSDEAPVACGLLIRTGDVAGVYNIGVIPDHRRHGIGEAMTWAVLRTGREASATVGVLQSSEMGYPVYERLGFETVIDYHRFQTAE